MIRTEEGAVVGSLNRAELEPDEGEDLSKLLKAELVERAEQAGVDTDGLTKADLVAVLESLETEEG